MTDKYFNSVYLKHYKEILYFANKILQDWEDAQDICSDAFIKVYTKKDLDPDNIRAYLYHTVKTLCYDFIKVQKNRRNISNSIMQLQDEFVDAIEIKSDLIGQIMAQVEKLPKDRRNIFIRWINGYDTREIADEFGLSIDTIRVQNHRSVNAIIKALGVTKKKVELTPEQKKKIDLQNRRKSSRRYTLNKSYD